MTSYFARDFAAAIDACREVPRVRPAFSHPPTVESRNPTRPPCQLAGHHAANDTPGMSDISVP